MKNFNIGRNFNIIRRRALQFQVCIPKDKTFHMVP